MTGSGQQDQDLRDDNEHMTDLKNFAFLYDQNDNGSTTVDSISDKDSLERLTQHVFTDSKQRYADNRTTQLWLQYMDMVGILQQVIRAERTGS